MVKLMNILTIILSFIKALSRYLPTYYFKLLTGLNVDNLRSIVKNNVQTVKIVKNN